MRRDQARAVDPRADGFDDTVISLQQHQRRRHHQAIQDAYNEGTMAGFCLGILAALIAWFFLSGVMGRMLVALVAAVLALGGRS